jgi:gamma-glutamylcyclotransferase
MLRYFAYGSNMHPDQMARHVPDASVVGIGRLDGFGLAFSLYSSGWEGGVANLEPNDAAHVWGVVWQMTEDGIAALDRYEGHPTFYRRQEVSVTTPDGEALSAWTYRVAHQQGFVRPTDAYLHAMESAVRLQGLPPEALDLLERAARPPGPSISI